MQVELVLTAIAEDRPGLVETLAGIIADHSGNWIDSEMARLGGEFAGILRISVPEASVGTLEQALGGLSDKGISVTMRKARHDEPRPGRHARLDLTGQDHTGIVLEATRVLARQGVNVDALHTRVFPGSMSGEAMFQAQADVVLPDGLAIEDLRDALELIAHDLMVDIALEEID
jgi:glycine cleavage system regulatory protein